MFNERYGLSAQEMTAFVGPAVVTCDDSPPDQWLDQVAGEFDPASLVFIWCDETKPMTEDQPQATS